MEEFQAYWDDKNSITLEIGKNKNNIGENFFLDYHEQLEQLEVLAKVEREEKIILQCRTTIDLEVGQFFQIIDEYQNAIPVMPRAITRSEWFDQQFYYDGNDLGVLYTSDSTLFTLWAPTANAVAVRLFTKDSKETIHTLMRQEKGVYQIRLDGDFADCAYTYLVKNGGDWCEVIDPYATATLADETKSFILNPEKAKVDLQNEKVKSSFDATDAVIYEVHIRDFTSDTTINFPGNSKFQRFIETGVKTAKGEAVGIDYLESLGITHVQLLPIFDYGSISERHQNNRYNWGYDPVQYNVPEGSYASNVQNPYTRIVELKQVIAALHERGIRVNMDVVYNHVYKVEKFSLNKIVPGYFSRYTDVTTLSNGSGCGNDTATERRMVRKFIVDSVKHWMNEYGIDGFRFDLMGLMDTETMKQIAYELRLINPSVMLYGEGWEMQTAYPKEKLATYGNAAQLLEYGFFNDQFRDDIKGSTFDLSDLGIINGHIARAENLKRLLRGSSSVNYGHNLFSQPYQSINYVSCHDGYTLFDKIIATSLNSGLEVVKAQHRQAVAMVLLSQGVAFIHGGCEFYRTKKGRENSYNLLDEINMYDWHRMEKNKSSVTYFSGLVAIRRMHKAFRFNSIEEIERHVSVDVRGSIIEYSLRNVGGYGPYNEIKVIFNIGDEPVDYNFETEFWCLAHNRTASATPLFKTEMLALLPYTTAIVVR